MIDVAQQQAAGRLVDDQADVAADAYGPEVLVLRLVEPVELHAGARRVHLEVERGRLHQLLLVAGETGEAVGERVGDAEVHGTAILSSSSRHEVQSYPPPTTQKKDCTS